jgi:hypothetical protein
MRLAIVSGILLVGLAGCAGHVSGGSASTVATADTGGRSVGESCGRDAECISRRCVSGTCQPRPVYEPDDKCTPEGDIYCDSSEEQKRMPPDSLVCVPDDSSQSAFHCQDLSEQTSCTPGGSDCDDRTQVCITVSAGSFCVDR